MLAACCLPTVRHSCYIGHPNFTRSYARPRLRRLNAVGYRRRRFGGGWPPKYPTVGMRRLYGQRGLPPTSLSACFNILYLKLSLDGVVADRSWSSFPATLASASTGSRRAIRFVTCLTARCGRTTWARQNPRPSLSRLSSTMPGWHPIKSSTSTTKHRHSHPHVRAGFVAFRSSLGEAIWCANSCSHMVFCADHRFVV